MDTRPLHIAATEETPEVRLNADGSVSVISGRSLPENAFDFYDPIIQWVKRFTATSSQPLILELRFQYFNSSSGRYLFELLHILEQSKYKQSYKITWLADADDELMSEKGEELKSLCDIPFDVALG